MIVGQIQGILNIKDGHARRKDGHAQRKDSYARRKPMNNISTWMILMLDEMLYHWFKYSQNVLMKEKSGSFEKKQKKNYIISATFHDMTLKCWMECWIGLLWPIAHSRSVYCCFRHFGCLEVAVKCLEKKRRK